MENSQMKAHNLAQEVNRFYKQQKQLRTIYSDTRSAFAEVQRAGLSRGGLTASGSFGSFGSFSFSSSAYSSDAKDSGSAGFAELSLTAERKLELVTKSKLCLFIMGDAAIEKLALVNELLSLNLMPVDALREYVNRENSQSDAFKLLNVKIMHSNKLSINFRLLDENVDLFELVENSSTYSTSPPLTATMGDSVKQGSTTPTAAVSLNDLIMRTKDSSSQTASQSNLKAKALLEVGVDSPLLRYGTQIVVTSTFVAPNNADASFTATDSTTSSDVDANANQKTADEMRTRELNDDLRALLNHVHSVPCETMLSVYMHVTDGEPPSVSHTRSNLQEVRTRHVNAVPIFVLHRALLTPQHAANGSSEAEQQTQIMFDASFANSLSAVGFNILDPQADGGAMFDVTRLSDAAVASELLASLTDSLEEVTSASQPGSNALQPMIIPPARCDVMLVDRLCIAALSSISSRNTSRRTAQLPELVVTPGATCASIHAALQFCCVRAISFGLKRLVVNGTTQLHEAHRGTLQQFILTAFDMARDMQITPKRLAFVREKEQALYDALIALASRKQEEIRALVAETITSMHRSMPTLIERTFGMADDTTDSSAETVRSEAARIREMVLSRLNNEIAEQLVHSVNVLRESYTGTLARCVRSLESEAAPPPTVASTSSPAADTSSPVSHAAPEAGAESADETETDPPKNGESLSRSQSLPTVADPTSTDTLKLTAMLHGRFAEPGTSGTSSAFVSGASSQSSAVSAIDSLKRIIASIYSFDITLQSSSSFVRVLLERVKELLRAAPWNVPSRVDNAWRVAVAREMLTSLSDARLARCVATQIREKLRSAHETFAGALRSLETKHSGRLKNAEMMRNELRKRYTPRIARLLLEAISLRDVTLFGIPQHGRELGRGQYGVVYACDSWANHGPCAVKSVVPPDERHWNDLALEFYYTRRIGEHERIVAIRGCVIDYSFLAISGAGPAVLLIMDKLLRDLHQAIRLGIDWLTRTLMPHDRIVPYLGVVVNYDHVHTRRTKLPEIRFLCQLLDCDLEVALMHSYLTWTSRLQITIDVVEGLRYLHSQGLVHRDIKLKNVLLDKQNRAKITDLGFCKPEAMMSGSIVGTPIHMAPELFSGKYDASVDVYAFGILFWYICAGHVRLPSNLDQCTSKDMLWSSVRRGVRPERLPHFEDWCWQLMSACWVPDPLRRILLGDAEPLLREKLEEERRRRTAKRTERTSSSAQSATHRRSRSNSPVTILEKGQS